MIKKIILLALIISTSLCFTFLETDNNRKLISKHATSEAEKQNLNYKIYNYEENPFKDWTLKQAKNHLGAKNLNTNSNYVEEDDLSELPESFDWREQTPNCVNEIRNQGYCGSCWAFALTNVLTDRLCIQTQGKERIEFSPQDLVSCDRYNYGCQGGDMFISWLYTNYYGVCTEECKEYVSIMGYSPPCERRCSNTEKRIDYKLYRNDYPKHFDTITSIKNEIMTNGPVESAFIVHDDFYYYRSGVYTYNWGDVLGGHAIKIVGWGLEKETNTKYWIVANSWGRQWGEDGYFKIGLYECSIHTNVHSANPMF